MVNDAGNLVGIIPKRFLKVLIESKEFILMSSMNYDTRNMRSANALMYLSPQYENYMVTPVPAIAEEEEYAINTDDRRSGLMDDISFRGGTSEHDSHSFGYSHQHPMTATALPRTQRFQSALKDHTTYSQYAGDVETSVINGRKPAAEGGEINSKSKLSWKDFKSERYESKHDDRQKIELICLENYRKYVNLANYMIEEP